RIPDRTAEAGKISAKLLRCGNEDRSRRAERLLLLLEVDKPESAIAAVIELRDKHRSASGDAVLIALALDFLGQKEIACIQFVIAEEFVNTAVKLVGAAPGRHFDNTRCVTVPRRRDTGLDGELLHCVRARAG